jgi:hypothetical protein
MDDKKAKQTAGALDIRNIIGILMAVYGGILLVMGLFGDTAPERTGDVNANLWAGLALILVGAGFLTWAKLRPIVVPEDVEQEASDTPRAPGEPAH